MLTNISLPQFNAFLIASLKGLLLLPQFIAHVSDHKVPKRCIQCPTDTYSACVLWPMLMTATGGWTAYTEAEVRKHYYTP